MPRACPNCGSTAVERRSSVVAVLGGGASYRCQECGYEGMAPVVDDGAEEAFREEVRHRADLTVEEGGGPDRSRAVLGAVLVVLGVAPLVYGGAGQRLVGIVAVVAGAAVLARQVRG